MITIRPLPDTVLVARIRSARSASQVKALMDYDLPQDPVTRGLCMALMDALDAANAPLPDCDYCGRMR